MENEWRETSNGNWVLAGDEGIEATVYAAGSEWGAVWNGASDGKAPSESEMSEQRRSDCRHRSSNR